MEKYKQLELAFEVMKFVPMAAILSIALIVYIVKFEHMVHSNIVANGIDYWATSTGISLIPTVILQAIPRNNWPFFSKILENPLWAIRIGTASLIAILLMWLFSIVKYCIQ